MRLSSILSITVQLLARAGWAPVSVFLLDVFITYGVNGDKLFPSADIPMHFLGGIAMAYFLWSCFAALPEGAIEATLRPLAAAVFVVSLTATAAILWEFWEFAFDVLLSTHMQGGLEDTLLDMALGVVGGITYVLIAWQQRTLGSEWKITAGKNQNEQR